MLRSLQGRLAAALVAGLTVLSLAAGAAAFHVLRHEIDRISDSSLQEAAQRLLPLAVVDIVGRDADAGSGHRAALVRPHVELLTYIVRGKDGRTLLRSHDAVDAVFPPDLKAGFATTATHRVYAEAALQGSMSLLVAEPLAARRHAQIKAALAVGRPVALFLPLGLIGIWLIVRTGLRPIRRFCGSIAARGQNASPWPSHTSRERTIQPASAPAATGTSTATSIQMLAFSGTSPSTGMPGTTPSWVPAGETAVPVPRAKPGPASQLTDQTTSVGR